MEYDAGENEGWRPHARMEIIDWDPYRADTEWKEAISVKVRFRDVIPKHQEVRYEKAYHKREYRVCFVKRTSLQQTASVG